MTPYRLSGSSAASRVVGAAAVHHAQRARWRSALWLVVDAVRARGDVRRCSTRSSSRRCRCSVYAGAIMVLFLFVIMLLNLGAPGADRHQGPRRAGGRRVVLGGRAAGSSCSAAARSAAPPDAIRLPAGRAGRAVEHAQGHGAARSRSPLFEHVPDSVRDHRACCCSPRSSAPSCSPSGSSDAPRPVARRLRRSCSRSASPACSLRRNAIVIFMCVELMLNAVNLTFVALAQRLGRGRADLRVLRHGRRRPPKRAVGLAIILAVYRHTQTVDLDNINLLKG